MRSIATADMEGMRELHPPIPVLEALPDQLAGAWCDAVQQAQVHATVLVVERRQREQRILRAVVEEESYSVRVAGDTESANRVLVREPVGLVVMGSLGRRNEAVEFCRRLRTERQTRLTPVLMVVARDNSKEEAALIEAGADEILSRPLRPKMLAARIRSLLRYKATVDRLEESESILFALAEAVEQRDPYTSGHCERLALYGVALGMAMGLPRHNLLALHRGGYLHDIGKVGMPDAILFKAGPLNESEWRVMRTHTVRGEAICSPMRCLAPVLPIIRSHHEKWDGTGYPDGLRGERIPLLARVLQCADIFDALTTVRPYKTAQSTQAALQTLWAETHEGWRDPVLMRVFARLPLELLRETAADQVGRRGDAEAMQRSLRNLRLAVG